MKGEWQSKKDYFSKYQSSTHGLQESQVTKNRQAFGNNELVTVQQESLLTAIIKELISFFPILLIAAGSLSLFAHNISPGEGYNYIAYALYGVVILNAAVSLVQKRKVKAIMNSFASYIPEEVVVNRAGHEQVITAGEVVCGDIIELAEGDKIPADAIVLQASDLQVDESILTGESATAHKSPYEGEEDGIIFSGTTILQGNCKAMVIAVGKNTKFGRVAELTATVKQEITPMQKELEYFVQKISVLAIGLGAAFFLIGMFYLDNPFWTNLIFAIGIIVANVPEGLLPTVTLALTQASQKMAKKNAVVKSLESVETLGSCNVICTDKTGTLTQNKMTAKRVYLNGQDLPVEDKNTFLSSPAKQPFLEVLAICNNATSVEKKHGVTEYYGDPTETALCEFTDTMASTQELRSKFSVKYEKPFNSKDKFMSKVLDTGAGSYSVLKGAPEVILKKSTKIHQDGSVQALTTQQQKHIQEQLHSYEHEGLRVLALAYYTTDNNHEDPKDIVFVGLIALIDPPKPSVKQAVADCKSAGIRIIVISGDNETTVKAIARQVGIAENPRAVTGEELAVLNDKQLDTLLDEHYELVFARTAPEQKLRIVTALQKRGDRVAVTGDGVNDAPALQKADIGVSMGKNGTDVAKDASDIILLDDNFATIVEAIKQGRAVFDNIKKFITYVLTSNIPEIMPFLAYVIFYPNIPLALTVLQILTIDLVTDILPSIGLGNEEPEKDVMKRKPREKSERLVSLKTFARSYGFIGPIETLFAFSSFFLVLYFGGWSYGAQVEALTYMYATSAFLATIITCQIGNVLACRTNRQSSLTKMHEKNWWMKLGVEVEVLLIAVIMWLPLSGFNGFLAGYFSLSEAAVAQAAMTTGIGLGQWAIIISVMIAAPIALFFAEELRKHFARNGVKWLDV